VTFDTDGDCATGDPLTTWLVDFRPHPTAAKTTTQRAYRSSGSRGFICFLGILSRLGRHLFQATKFYVYSRLFEKIDVRFVAHSRLLHRLAQVIRSGERFRLVMIFH